MRESRAKRRARKAREFQEGEYVPSAEDEPLGLELDTLTDASGVGSSKKQVTPLEQVRLSQICGLLNWQLTDLLAVHGHSPDAARGWDRDDRQQ
jgi:hypothetical protein